MVLRAPPNQPNLSVSRCPHLYGGIRVEWGPHASRLECVSLAPGPDSIDNTHVLNAFRGVAIGGALLCVWTHQPWGSSRQGGPGVEGPLQCCPCRAVGGPPGGETLAAFPGAGLGRPRAVGARPWACEMSLTPRVAAGLL